MLATVPMVITVNLNSQVILELNHTCEAKLKLTTFMLVHKNQSTSNIDYHLIKESHLINIIILISPYHLQMDLWLGIAPNLETPVWSGLTQICGREWTPCTLQTHLTSHFSMIFFITRVIQTTKPNHVPFKGKSLKIPYICCLSWFHPDSMKYWLFNRDPYNGVIIIPIKLGRISSPTSWWFQSIWKILL